MSQLERIHFIDKHIRESSSVSIFQIMDAFGVSDRQAQRDLSFMRDHCDAPLVRNDASGRYEYGKPFDDLSFLDEDALLLKLLIYKVASLSQFIPYNRREFMRKIERIVPVRFKTVEDAIRFELPSFERAVRSRLSVFINAINDKVRVSFDYMDGSGRESSRIAEPRRLLNYSGTWYCFCVDSATGEVRNFKLSRIKDERLLNDRQTLAVPNAEIDRVIEDTYGAFKGAGRIRVKIRFIGKALATVRDEIWHDNQEQCFGSNPACGDYLDLSLTVHRFEELLGRILRFGSCAEPLEPAELRNAWIAEIKKMHEKYCPPTAGVGTTN